MNIKTRIANIVTQANAAQSSFMAGIGKLNGWDAFNASQTAIEKELNDIDKEAGEGLVVGRSLSFGVADGSATYIVTKVRKNDVVVAYVPLMDGYQFQGVYQNSKGELCLPRAVAERQCRMSSGLKSMFA